MSKIGAILGLSGASVISVIEQYIAVRVQFQVQCGYKHGTNALSGDPNGYSRKNPIRQVEGDHPQGRLADDS
jgi:hypothetical protein